MCVYWAMITTISQPPSPHIVTIFFLVMKVFKVYSPSILQMYNTVLLTLVKYRANTSTALTEPGPVLSAFMHRRHPLHSPLRRCCSYPHFTEGYTEPTQRGRCRAAGQEQGVSEGWAGRESLCPTAHPIQKVKGGLLSSIRQGTWEESAHRRGTKQSQERKHRKLLKRELN